MTAAVLDPTRSTSAAPEGRAKRLWGNVRRRLAETNQAIRQVVTPFVRTQAETPSELASLPADPIGVITEPIEVITERIPIAPAPRHAVRRSPVGPIGDRLRLTDDEVYKLTNELLAFVPAHGTAGLIPVVEPYDPKFHRLRAELSDAIHETMLNFGDSDSARLAGGIQVCEWLTEDQRFRVAETVLRVQDHLEARAQDVGGPLPRIPSARLEEIDPSAIDHLSKVSAAAPISSTPEAPAAEAPAIPAPRQPMLVIRPRRFRFDALQVSAAAAVGTVLALGATVVVAMQAFGPTAVTAQFLHEHDSHVTVVSEIATGATNPAFTVQVPPLPSKSAPIVGARLRQCPPNAKASPGPEPINLKVGDERIGRYGAKHLDAAAAAACEGDAERLLVEAGLTHWDGTLGNGAQHAAGDNLLITVKKIVQSNGKRPLTDALPAIDLADAFFLG